MSQQNPRFIHWWLKYLFSNYIFNGPHNILPTWYFCSRLQYSIHNLHSKGECLACQSFFKNGFQKRFAHADDRADLARITSIVAFNCTGLIALYFIVYVLFDFEGSVRLICQQQQSCNVLPRSNHKKIDNIEIVEPSIKVDAWLDLMNIQKLISQIWQRQSVSSCPHRLRQFLLQLFVSFMWDFQNVSCWWQSWKLQTFSFRFKWEWSGVARWFFGVWCIWFWFRTNCRFITNS